MINLNGQIDDLNVGDTFDSDDTGLEPVQVFKDSFDEPDIKKTDKIEPVVNPFEPKDEKTFEDDDSPRNKIIDDLLKQRGIVDSSKVLYENEKGETVEVDFYSLPYEDQVNILSENNEGTNDGLSEEDLYYIAQAKENNISLTELIQYYLNQSIEEYTKSQLPAYLVTDYSDEELYVADMKAKLGDSITDDEILTLLQKELEIPEIFKKKVDKLREDYIKLEEEERLNAANAIGNEKAAAFDEFKDTISTLVDTVEDVGGVSLEDTDKNDILKFMLEQDVNGTTEFQKLMNDPENIFLAAWAILKAEDTFEILKGHYEDLLKASKKIQPEKKDLGTQTKVVQKIREDKKYMTVEDLHKFD